MDPFGVPVKLGIRLRLEPCSSTHLAETIIGKSVSIVNTQHLAIFAE
jgi:hypothetical protein